jgi:hypothetical protein
MTAAGVGSVNAEFKGTHGTAMVHKNKHAGCRNQEGCQHKQYDRFFQVLNHYISSPDAKIINEVPPAESL